MSRQDDNSASVTTEDRIKQLNELERDIAQLLKSAGLAVEALTDRPLSQQHGDVSSKKEIFTKHASQYFSRLSAVDVRLRRQIYALEEAQIIQPEGAKDGSTQTSSFAANLVASQNSEKSAGGAGGQSNLDVAWLNSRNDQVAKEFEAEIWEEAEILLKELVAGDTGSLGRDLSKQVDGMEQEDAEHKHAEEEDAKQKDAEQEHVEHIDAENGTIG